VSRTVQFSTFTRVQLGKLVAEFEQAESQLMRFEDAALVDFVLAEVPAKGEATHPRVD
jgi:hypothetical protein